VKGFTGNIEQLTVDNLNFRKVLYTGKNLQLVLMNLRPGESIGAEVHPDIDQFFRFEQGHGVCEVDENSYPVSADDAVVVPAGAEHNVINNGESDLRFYTIYGPPEHRDQLVHTTHGEASEEHFDGVTTE